MLDNADFKGYTISKKLYEDIYTRKNPKLHKQLDEFYLLFLSGYYGYIADFEKEENRINREYNIGRVVAVYTHPNIREEVVFIYNYNLHHNKLIRVLYRSEIYKH